MEKFEGKGKVQAFGGHEEGTKENRKNLHFQFKPKAKADTRWPKL